MNYFHYGKKTLETETFVNPGRNCKWILVIEEDEGVRSLLSCVIRKMGYNVTVVCSGEKGLTCFQERFYNLVITDLTMIAMDGWTVARHIKEMSPGTPVGIITGWSRSDVLPRLEKSAADFAVFKSSDINELRNAIEFCLKGE
ncbi:MAG: response regulator [Desulfobacterales bacterium]|nr:response regulator [Desulfobacterales bacterium]